MENNNLASALCKAQAEMGAAIEGGYNPHFKSSFATLTDLINASRPALTKNGLAITQYPESFEGNTYLVTQLMHVSGDKIRSQVIMVLDKPSDVQAFGKAMTYLKRYVYAAIIGITISDADEDDGNTSATYTTDLYAKSSPSISDKQLGLLKAKLRSQPEREASLLKAYNITELSQLPWKKMDEVVKILDTPKA